MHELNFVTIGKKIKLQRKKLHLTQEYVANMLDVNPSHVSNIECGRVNPSLMALVNIADILHCSVDCFLDTEYDFANSSSASLENSSDQPKYDLNITNSLITRITKKLENRDDGFKKKILKIIDII